MVMKDLRSICAGWTTGWVVVMAGMFLAGCQMPWGGKKKAQTVEPLLLKLDGGGKGGKLTVVELQGQVMGLADAFMIALVNEAGKLREEVGDEVLSRQVLQWKLSHASVLTVMASGPNPVVNMLDVVSTITLSRMVWEDYWMEKVVGEKGSGLLQLHREYEGEAWELAGTILQAEQLEQLRLIIDEWRAANPDQRYASVVTLSEYARQRRQSPLAPGGSVSSLFGLFSLDPLASLDPATRELAETRYFAERTMYYLQRLPFLVRLQAELLVANVTATPEMRTVYESMAGYRKAADRFVETLEDLPRKLADEQRRVLDEVTAEGNKMEGMLQSFAEAFREGRAMAAAVNQSVTNLDQFIAGLREEKAGDEREAEGVTKHPFDVREYGEAALRIGVASSNLSQTVEALSGLLESKAWGERQGELARLVDGVGEGGEHLLSMAFWRGLILITVFLLGLLAVLLVYGWAVKGGMGRPKA